MKIILKIIFILTLFFSIVSCGKKSTENSSDDISVIKPEQIDDLGLEEEQEEVSEDSNNEIE
jgi:basic membrane lipoprotein Med (substrate-binding protein (PBP1-ABC) superfamily)